MLEFSLKDSLKVFYHETTLNLLVESRREQMHLRGILPIVILSKLTGTGKLSRSDNSAKSDSGKMSSEKCFSCTLILI